MVSFRVVGFSGVVPRRGARALDDNQAQIAVNCRLTSGYVGPLKEPLSVTSPGVAGILSIFRMPDTTDRWLAWNVDVDAVKGPIAGDTSYRTYYTGDNEPRVTNISLATAGTPYPYNAYVLGVYPPATAPGASHSGGSGAAIDRAFVYTFVTQWGEESAPSPASSVTTGKVDGTWTVNSMDTAPANTFTVTSASWSAGVATYNVSSTFGMRVGEEVTITGASPSGYNVTGVLTEVNSGNMKLAISADPGAWSSGGTITRVASHNTTDMMKRIYWTETTVSGTEYQFVKEVTAATTSTTVAGNTVADEVLPSTDWNMPPVDLKGLVLHPSGALVGLSKNELCFSEPYKPYAWPNAYRMTLGFDGVGLGIFGNTVVACTEGTPYVTSGADPASMGAPEEIQQPWPCLAKRGIVSMGFGVMYPAPQGLALIGTSGSDLVTKDLYTQEEWKLLSPETFVAAQYAGRYVASYEAGENNRQIVIIDKSEFASVVGANKNATALFGDKATGKLYVVVGDEIMEWDADTGQKMSMDWLSKEYVFPKPVNLGAAKVDADFTMTSDEVVAANEASEALEALNASLIAALATKGSMNAYSLGGMSVNGSLVEAMPGVTWDSLTFQLYVDGELKFSRTLTDSRAFTLPSGYKADTAAVRVLGNITVKGIVVAETMRGLAAA